MKNENGEKISRMEEDGCTGLFPAKHWGSVAQLGQCEDKKLELAGCQFVPLGAPSSLRSLSDAAELAPATNVCARSLSHTVKNLGVHSNE